jgi:hypothetical protein
MNEIIEKNSNLNKEILLKENELLLLKKIIDNSSKLYLEE